MQNYCFLKGFAKVCNAFLYTFNLFATFLTWFAVLLFGFEKRDSFDLAFAVIQPGAVFFTWQA